MVGFRRKEEKKMIDFQKYYKAYLGINENSSEKIFSSDRRDELFSLIYKQYLIMSKIEEDTYYSIAPKFYEKFKESFKQFQDLKNMDEILYEIDDTFCEYIDNYTISKYYRFSNPNRLKVEANLSSEVVALSDSHKELYFKLMGIRGNKFKEKQWEKRKYLINDERYFILIQNNEIAAYSIISDIDYGGANIVVVTFPKYRKKGYGRAVVAKSVEWCYRNDLIPVYLVNQLNIASINLAKSLGFELKAEEIIVSVQCR